MAEKWFEYATYMNNKVAQLQQLDASWTLPKVEAAFKDAGFAGIEGAYNHFVEYGADEDVSPNALFNAESYYASKAASYFNVSPASNVSSDQVLFIKGAFADAGLNAWTHYIQYGTEEGINPSNNFDTTKYLQAKADAMGMTVDQVAKAISDAGMNALTHAILYSGEGSNEAASIFNDDGSVNEAYAVPEEEKTNVNTDSGQVYPLTVQTDTWTGTTGDDTFSAVDASTGNAVQQTWTAGDYLDGGAGNDTFSIVTDRPIDATPAGATVKDIENINITSTKNVTIDTSSFTGLEKLNVETSGSDQDLTAANDVDVTATVKGNIGNGIEVEGGKDVTVTSTAAKTADRLVGEITVTDAAGAVVVTDTVSKFDGSDGIAIGNINVTGGTTVEVTQTTGAYATTSSTVLNKTATHGDITVTGTAATTDVTVTQDKGQVASATKVGVANGNVEITDANATSATAAGTIKTVTVNNAAQLTVKGNAIDTMNLSGTIADIQAGNLSVLDTAAVTSLTINVDGVRQSDKSATAFDLDEDITELTINATGEDTRFDLTDAKLATLTVKGDGAVSLKENGPGQFVTDNLLTISSKDSTGGLDMGDTAGALNKDAQFTGGAGNDSIIIGEGFTKAHSMGAGDDAVYYQGETAVDTYKGTVDGGAGTADKLKITNALAANLTASLGIGEETSDATDAFGAAFTNFEVLKIKTTAAGTDSTFNLDWLSSKVTSLEVSNDSAVATNFLGVANSGTTLTLDGAAGGGASAGISFATAKNEHSLNVVLESGDENPVQTDYGEISFTGATKTSLIIDTAANDSGVDSFQKILNIVDSGAGNTAITSISLTGNNGLNLSGSDKNLIASVDAGGLSLAADTKIGDNYDNIGVLFDASNVAADVTFNGGIGNDEFTGSGAKNNTVNISNGGADTVKLGANTVATVGTTTIKGFTMGTEANVADTFDVNTISGGTFAYGTEVTKSDSWTEIATQQLYRVEYGKAIASLDFSSKDDFAKLFGELEKDGTAFRDNVTSAVDSLLVIEGTDQTQIYLVNAAAAGDLTRDNVALVAVLDGVTADASFDASNFGL